MKQARELGIAVRAAVPDGEIAFVGGDMNAGPYIARDTWTGTDGTESSGKWSDTLS